ncbi:MAG: lipoate--protein ligase [Eubacteriales bacterium]
MLFEKTEPVYLISHEFNDPAFNLACEEYFFHQRTENYILLWRNSPAIIIGRNQNAYAELDMDYVAENAIPVIRRLTGGGSVYHDLGNLNFTFITNGADGLADFKVFLKPITEYLCSIGLDAEFSGRNDILLKGMKISGNAQANYKGRVMLHGTLLFSVSLSVLAKALKPNLVKLTAKGIGSVRSRVTNISEHLTRSMGVEELKEELAVFLTSTESCVPYIITAEDETEIKKLVDEKYGTWGWNIGSAPSYSMESTALLTGGMVTVNFDVYEGKIISIKIFGDFFGSQEISELEQKITGTPHERQALLATLEGFELQKYIANGTVPEFVELFFS